MFPNKEKLALFSDGANLYATAKSLGFDSEFDGEQYAKKSDRCDWDAGPTMES
jgi:hypothetical protein